MRRAPSPYGSTFSFGPGPLSLALKAIIGANVLLFVVQVFLPRTTEVLGLVPYRVMHGAQIWRLGTYMFLHAGVTHVAVNMLTLWMFGTELERVWGTRYFLKFYFTTPTGSTIRTGRSICTSSSRSRRATSC